MKNLVKTFNNHPVIFFISTAIFFIGVGWAVCDKVVVNEKNAIIEKLKIKVSDLEKKEKLVTFHELKKETTHKIMNLESDKELANDEIKNLENDLNKTKSDLHKYKEIASTRKKSLEEILEKINSLENEFNNLKKKSNPTRVSINLKPEDIKVKKVSKLNCSTKSLYEKFSNSNIDKNCLSLIISDKTVNRAGSVRQLCHELSKRQDDDNLQKHIVEYYIPKLPELIDDDRYHEVFNAAKVLININPKIVSEYESDLRGIFLPIKEDNDWSETIKLYKIMFH